MANTLENCEYSPNIQKWDQKQIRFKKKTISILSNLSKICEAVIPDRLLGHLSENNIIPGGQ